MTNREKNTFVKEQIRNTMLRLLERESIAAISIRDLCREAGVGRASFYRNYQTKEDVIREHTEMLMQQWGRDFENGLTSGPSNVFGSLFDHYKKHESFYCLLCRQNLSYLMLDTIKKAVGLLPELSNRDAYEKAFFAYGFYGWVLEWIFRGMPESPEEMNQMYLQNRTDASK